MPGTRRASGADPLARLLVRSLVIVSLIAGCLTAAESRGRDDVPPEIAKLENPVPPLDEKQVRYFARQFKGKCARCHGAAGDGGGEEAGGQTIPPTNFTDAAYMATRSDGQLYFQILAGGGERCAMPAFGPGTDHGWTQEKVWSMVHFVRRFSQAP